MKHLCLYVYPLEPTGPSITHYSVYDLTQVITFLQKQSSDTTYNDSTFNYYENPEGISCLDIVKQMLQTDEQSLQKVTSHYIFSFIYVTDQVYDYLNKKRSFSGYTITAPLKGMRFTVNPQTLTGHYNGQDGIKQQSIASLYSIDGLDTVLSCAIKKIVKDNLTNNIVENRIFSDGVNNYKVSTFAITGTTVLVECYTYHACPSKRRNTGYRKYYV